MLLHLGCFESQGKVILQAPTSAQAQPASSNSLVQNGSINGIPVWAYGVMGMLAGLIVLGAVGKAYALIPQMKKAACKVSPWVISEALPLWWGAS